MQYKEERNNELVLFYTLLEHRNRSISVLVYRKPTYLDQFMYYNYNP